MRNLRKYNENLQNLEEVVIDELEDLRDSGFSFDVFSGQTKISLRVYKPIQKNKEYTYDNCREFEWIEVEDDLYRLIKNFDMKLDYITTIHKLRSEFSVSREFMSVEDFNTREVSIRPLKSVTFFFFK